MTGGCEDGYLSFGNPYHFLNQSNFGNLTRFYKDNVTSAYQLMLTPLWNTTQDSYLERQLYFEVDLVYNETQNYSIQLIDPISGMSYFSGTLGANTTSFGTTILAPIDRPLLMNLTAPNAASMTGYCFLGYVFNEPMASAAYLQSEEDTLVF